MRSKKSRKPRSKKSRKSRKTRSKKSRKFRRRRSKRNDGTMKERWNSFTSSLNEKWKKFIKSLRRSPSLNVLGGINLFSNKGSSIDVINELLELIKQVNNYYPENEKFVYYNNKQEKYMRQKIRSIRGIRPTLKYKLLTSFGIINKALSYMKKNYKEDDDDRADMKEMVTIIKKQKGLLHDLLNQEQNNKNNLVKVKRATESLDDYFHHYHPHHSPSYE
jgi:hypothetical protein